VAGSPSLVENLLRSADRHPERYAIQEGSILISYARLRNQVVAIAAQLQRLGLRPGERVAIILPNSGEFVAAYYGILMAGGVAVLLNAAAKSRDFISWLGDSECTFVLAEANNNEVAAAIAASERKPRFIAASGDPDAPFGLALDTPPFSPPVVGGHEPACILYTSGTTGKPKGVVLSHHNLLSNTASIVEYLGLTAEDSIVTILPFYYSYGSSVLHTHLRAGGRVILEKNLLYPHAVVETLAKERATGFAGVPSTFALLLSRVKLQDYDLSAIRYVTQAGGAMSPALTQRLREALPKAAVFVMYGQTEATARLTYLPPASLEAKLGSVGIPVPGVSIEIRREDGSAAAVDEVGEIWVSGPNVMLGYWRNDAATSEVKRDGWLKTGDMGRRDADGFIFIVGRRSDMIKAGAHRVHPQDIEDVIAELPQVQEVAVVGVEDELLGQTIRAFVVPAPGQTVTPMQVQALCKAKLAAYKIPKTVEIIASLPRTASGKIRRAELIERMKS
jgi:acyl-CoA synthetase (AMP-forming)/AMP-acid ligase II